MYRQDLSLAASLGMDYGSYTLMARIYLLRLALSIVNSTARPNPIFSDEHSCQLLAIPTLEFEAWYGDDVDGTPQIRAYLEDELASAIMNVPIFDKTVLGQNLAWLSTAMKLNRIEGQILQMIVLLHLVPPFYTALPGLGLRGAAQETRQLMAILCGSTVPEISQVTTSRGRLTRSGLFIMNEDVTGLEDQFPLAVGLQHILATRFRNASQLMACFYRQLPPGRRTERLFDHLEQDFQIIRSLLKSAIRQRKKGVHILIHGLAAEGKREFAQHVAAAAGLKVLEVSHNKDNKQALRGDDRLTPLLMSYRACEGHNDRVVLVEEAEDIFPANFCCDADMSHHARMPPEEPGERWVFGMLDKAPVPMIWTTQKLFKIAPSYLERFDYVLELPNQPKAHRQSVAETCFAGRDQNWIASLADWRDLSPTQIRTAARTSKLVGSQQGGSMEQVAERVLMNVTKAINGTNRIPRRRSPTGYRLDCLNTNLDLTPLIAGLKARPEGTFCFYGPPGTGKTALARYLADVIDRPLLVKRASDLLAKYVGESEQNISAMFTEAREQGAVLVLDEADSFLNDRRGAEYQWEVTQVNEMLFCMEDYDGIFVCTTNLMDRIDPAALRRFAFKVRFDFLKPQQRLDLFEETWMRTSPVTGPVSSSVRKRLEKLDQLTPGDFAAVARQHNILGTLLTAEVLVEGLEEECRIKGGQGRGVGFLTA